MSVLTLALCARLSRHPVSYLVHIKSLHIASHHCTISYKFTVNVDNERP